ncbi:centrosomin isoform X5 [Scaptodrosophila lebanonensis]|uniref:Centrosomin isoform X5 n=1 Tax=Drosophila lebanonensis TaxID=7225 RepID=A0A6J2UIK5_DROLE|nr:centrosomin isoform X5 [Scaptodrosophila lebanonensis]
MHKNQENSLFKSNKSSQNGSSCANQDHSQQAPREYCDANDVSSLSSMKEITLIETVTTFLEENGAAEVDPKVLRHLAEALSKRIDDTSPGGLQDVTMENSYNSFDAARTQGIGGSSPIMLQGRSVRELEEQMSSLRKENFNLKLRIYFMEEGQTPVRGNNSHDSLSKQLVDLKIEIEVLRKAVAEKTELLKDAARAIEQHEDMQQKTDMENQRLIEQLQHNIEQMESKMMHSEAQKSMDVLCNGQIKRMEDEVNKLECALKEADLERKASHCQIQKLEHELNERQESLISCEAKIEELAIKNAELVHKMERHEKATELSNNELKYQKAEIHMCVNENQRLVNSLSGIEHELIRQSSSLKEATSAMDMQRHTIQLLEDTIKEKDCAYSRLLKRLIECEGIISKQGAEMDLVRRENEFFRALIDSLQRHNTNQQLSMERVAIVQPMRNSDNYDNNNNNVAYSVRGQGSKGAYEHGEVIAHCCANEECSASMYTLQGLSQEQQQPHKAAATSCRITHSIAKHGFLQLFTAELNWISTIPLALGQFALRMTYLAVRLHNTILCMDAPLQPKSELAAQLADKMCELQDTEEKLKERERIHEQALRTIQKLMQKLSSQDKEIKRLNQEHSNRKQDNSADAIISGSENRAHSDSEALVAETTTSLKERLAEQEETIKELRAEIKKKTANLQNLVNKELWEKNREVERLTKLLASQQLIAEEGADLQQSCTEQDYTKALERNKLLQRKVDVLIKRLGEEQHNDALISQLRHELNLVRADAESANKWRLECADVCGVLTNRLEELAGFLNSLLKHKDVLGVLAADRRHAMRRAVDRSLDLSKSLNMTLSITGTSLADQSLTQLCNLSEILVADADDCNRTYNSHEEIRAEGSHNGPTMETLKAENKALKRELEKRRSTDGQMRKERRSLPLSMQQQQLDNQSESEAWSEPDRKVSLARMGLDENSQSLACEQKQQLTESDSEGQSRMTSAATRQERARQSERIAHLEELIAQRDERILNVQCQLVDSDNRYKQEQLRVIELSQQLDQLRARNEELQADLKLIGTQEDQQLAELQHLLDQRTKQFEDLQMTHKVLTADAEITEMELQAVRQQFTELQSEHESDLRQAKLEMQQLKQEATEKLEEQRQSHEDKLSRDWIALSLYEEQKQQLLELQRQHVDCMQNLEYHQELEKELKQSLVDNELTARALKKQLDESALQASKAVMERTKAYNDKLQLEERLEQLKTQLALIKDEPQQQQQQQQLRQPPKRLNSSDVSQSGYTSEEVPVSVMKSRATASANAAVVAQRMNNSSPDLGIESDAGRVSSVELSNAQRTQLKTVELKSKKGDGADEDKSNIGGGDAASAIHDCAKVDQENAELRRKLTRTKRAFEDTYEKLRLANKAKAQVEKDIKNQILKTHNVLRNVRSNMENEL